MQNIIHVIILFTIYYVDKYTNVYLNMLICEKTYNIKYNMRNYIIYNILY
jgi:hypothetical protein